MWYSYKLSLLSDNKMKIFSEELESSFLNIFNNTPDNSDISIPEFKKFIHKNLRNNLHSSCGFFSDFNFFFQAYKNLNDIHKNYLKYAFKTNIDIESISKAEKKGVTYLDIQLNINLELSNILKNLFDNLYKNLKENDCFKNKYISPLKYYQHLREKNIVKQVCPFCGYNQTTMPGEDFREDYDHYLSKSIYPFISLHYKNLVPMCEKCNSDYKSTKIFTNKFFYPFSEDIGENKLNILNIKNTSLQNSLIDIDIINSGSDTKVSEINNWDSIFEIKKRSKLKIEEIKSNVIESIIFLSLKKKSLNLQEWLDDHLCECQSNKFCELNIFKISLYEYYLKNIEDIESIMKSISANTKKEISEVDNRYKYK